MVEGPTLREEAEVKGKVISSYGPHEIEVSVVYPGEDSSRHQDVCLETQEGHLG